MSRGRPIRRRARVVVPMSHFCSSSLKPGSLGHSMNVIQQGPYVSVTAEMAADARAIADFLDREWREMLLDLTVGPRFGPPAPQSEPARCETCGQILDDWDDD